MKLVHPDFLFQIEFKENKVTNIIIEAPEVFEKFLAEIYEQVLGNEGKWVLSENSIPLDLRKYVEIIINPFDIDINNKKILTKLYDRIKKNANETELYIKWNEMYSNIINVIEALIDDFDYSLEYSDEIELKEFLKLIDLRFSMNSTNSLERLMDYMNLHNEILGTKVFVLVNIKSFYSEERLKYLYEQTFYKKFALLFLENKEYYKHIDDEVRYIIDKDSCIISDMVE